jgi:hypothetical protein
MFISNTRQYLALREPMAAAHVPPDSMIEHAGVERPETPYSVS